MTNLRVVIGMSLGNGLEKPADSRQQRKSQATLSRPELFTTMTS